MHSHLPENGGQHDDWQLAAVMRMKDDDGQIQRTPASGGKQPQLSAVVASDRAPAPQDGAGAVMRMPSRPPALEGIRIPSRSTQARRLVVDLYGACPHLGRQPGAAAIAPCAECGKPGHYSDPEAGEWWCKKPRPHLDYAPWTHEGPWPAVSAPAVAAGP